MKRQGVSHRPARERPLVKRAKRIQRYLAEDIWDEAQEPRSPVLRGLRRLVRIVYLAATGFRSDRCIFRASALTYVTVLSLVPLLALGFSVAKGVGAFETLKTQVVDPFLDENLVSLHPEPAEPDAAVESTEETEETQETEEPEAAPAAGGSEPDTDSETDTDTDTSESGPEVTPPPDGEAVGAAIEAEEDEDEDQGVDAIRELRRTIDEGLGVVEQTNFKALGLSGLVILLYAVIKMLGTVEGSLNDIWGVQRARTLVRKVSDYTTMVVVTPVLVLIALTMTTAAQDNSFVGWLRVQLHLGPVFDLLLRLTPLFAVWLGFAFLYLALPNTRTRIGSSLIGGVVGGTLWQLAQIGHVKFQLGMASQSAVYAGFAAVPIFLVWVQVSWITVLAGAEVAYAHQNEPAYRRRGQAVPRDHALRELLALRVAVRVGVAFLAGAKLWNSSRLSDELDVPGRELEEVLRPLVAGGVLAESGEGPELAYLPARDLESIHAVDILDALAHRRTARSPPSRARRCGRNRRASAARRRPPPRSDGSATRPPAAVPAPPGPPRARSRRRPSAAR
jgi:YihY family inner membrane protein